MANSLQQLSQDGILQWNCRGLSSKLGEIKTKLQYNKLHVWALLIQEHNKLCSLSNFNGYHNPSIKDRRATTMASAPGKAAVYVSSHIAHTVIDLEPWCSVNQEVVGVLARPVKTPVILVSFYARPQRTRLNLGWIAHLRSTYPGIPILVGGDFNAPHTEWGYKYNSRRGCQVKNVMSDATFTLLNLHAVATCAVPAVSRTHAPDLTWWLGPGMPQWRVEPDTWGSDHMPIMIGLRRTCIKKIRRNSHALG